MKKLFLMLLMVGAAFTASAQNTRQIHGAVVDQKTGNPLPGAKVEATGGAESTVTDADGSFTLEVSRWLKSLTATYPGMIKKKKSVKDSEVIFRMIPKQKPAWFVNLVGNITAYDARHEDLWTPGMGVMFGQVGKWGWYGKFMCDFKGPVNIEETNYRATNGYDLGLHYTPLYWDAVNQQVTTSYSHWDSNSKEYQYNVRIRCDENTDKNIKPGLTFTAGGIKSIVPNYFYGFLGVGYTTGYKRDYSRFSTLTFIDQDGVERTTNTPHSYENNTHDPGFAFEGGFIIRVKHFNAMLGFTTRFGAKDWDLTYTGNIGVGYVF